MPISAPIPNWLPSTSRVDALTSTAAASTSRVNRRAWREVIGDDRLGEARAVAADVTTAASRSSTTRIARIRSRYSGVPVGIGAGAPGHERAAFAGSRGAPRPPRARRAASAGSRPGATSRWTRGVSSALHTLGRCALALTTIAAAIAASAPAST